MTTISLAPPLPATRARACARRATFDKPVGFGASTRIHTLLGSQPVSTLMAGDLVMDCHGNLHELRGIRRIRVAGDTTVRLARKGRAPITVGGGQLLRSDDWRAQVVFGQAAVSAAARLVDGVGLRRGRPGTTTLYQLCFDSAFSLDIGGVVTRVRPAL